jgi:2-oxoacid:acceptor oxidoreductase gamma subunit (pyruvate/2-ketoisovalerate family)
VFEIRFHGRGGQGTVMAAKMLADAVLRAGRGECMAIPEFGVERRGAPVMAYARISDKPIRARTRIYSPDAVVILDPALASDPAVVAGLKPGGAIVLNSEASAAELAARWPGFRARAVPARRLALKHGLGPATSPMVNTAICGAVCAIFDLADADALEAAVRDAVPVKADANAAAAREAFELCREEAAHAPA